MCSSDLCHWDVFVAGDAGNACVRRAVQAVAQLVFRDYRRRLRQDRVAAAPRLCKELLGPLLVYHAAVVGEMSPRGTSAARWSAVTGAKLRGHSCARTR